MLAQVEADALITMPKRFVNPVTIWMPPGVDVTHELIGQDGREQFLLDMWRGTLRLSKVKLQTRGRKVVILVRLDVDGAPHTNPDGQRIPGTHLHIYREGYEDRWAYPLNSEDFPNPTNTAQTFHGFCRYCNVSETPPFQEGLV